MQVFYRILPLSPNRTRGSSVNMKSLFFATVALAAFSGYARGESCYCTEQYDPVCASNGKVFSNLCMLRCHNFNNHDNLKVAKFDKCSHPGLPSLQQFVQKKFNCFSLCPHTPLPVCGSDGVTYGSSCALNCEKQMDSSKQDVTKLYEGHCRPQLEEKFAMKFNCFRLCPHTPLPVCGTNGVTYGSACALNCMKKMDTNMHDVEILYHGSCKPLLQAEVAREPSSDVCVCTDEFKPVCGNNLHTYANRCAFECDAKKNPDLKVMYTGRCIILP